MYNTHAEFTRINYLLSLHDQQRKASTRRRRNGEHSSSLLIILRANFSSLVYQTGQNSQENLSEFEFNDKLVVERQWQFQLQLPFDPGFVHVIKALFFTLP